MAGLAQWSRVLNDADDETARLLIKLQIQDLEEAVTTTVSSEIATTDEIFALQTYEDELKQYLSTRALGIEEPSLEEAPGDATTSPNVTDQPVNPQLQYEVVKFPCAVCGDPYDADHCWQAPCSHYYCDDDLNDLFRRSMTDVTLYPPRCCQQNMPYEDLRMFLHQDLAHDFDTKKEELDDHKPTYCHRPTCSTYIGQENKDANVATCPECKVETCILCKEAVHEDDCAEDEAIRQTTELAQKEGWRRCPNCERMVELSIGCNHMM